MRLIIVSLLVTAAYLALTCGLATKPATATTDPRCTPAKWDPETRTITQDVPSNYPFKAYSVALSAREYSDCDTTYPQPSLIVLNLEKPLELIFETTHFLAMQRRNDTETKIEINTADKAPLPWIRLNIRNSKTPFPFSLTSDGIDINDDANTDITINAKSVKMLDFTYAAIDPSPINIDTSGSKIHYDDITVRAPSRLNRRITITNPTGHASVDAGDGNDIITLIARSGTVGANRGNDTINATRVTGTQVTPDFRGNRYSGDEGNDRILTGPGDDQIAEERKSLGNDYYNLGAGNDRATAYAGSDTIITGPGNDTISTSAAPGHTMNINAGTGNDFFYDRSHPTPGHTIANLGTGNDKARVQGGKPKFWLATIIHCGPGHDKLSAGGNNPNNRNCEIFR